MTSYPRFAFVVLLAGTLGSGTVWALYSGSPMGQPSSKPRSRKNWLASSLEMLSERLELGTRVPLELDLI